MRTLLVVGAMLLVAGCADDGPSSAPAPSAPASSPAAREHRGWSVVAHARADLDGDGRQDLVRVRESPGPRGLEVDVVLARRTVVLTMPRALSPDFEPVASADVDARPGDELFVMREVRVRKVRALSWADDHFVPIAAPAGQSLSDDFAPDVHARDWWTESGHVVAYRSVRACTAGYETVTCPARMWVEAQEWHVVDGRWQVRPLGRYCVDRDEPARLLRRCRLA